ncbi:hypothetical protein MTO96_000050 [Rhipicephalus appendiculatus]
MRSAFCFHGVPVSDGPRAHERPSIRTLQEGLSTEFRVIAETTVSANAAPGVFATATMLRSAKEESSFCTPTGRRGCTFRFEVTATEEESQVRIKSCMKTSGNTSR